jgi:uncharacterized membrane protein (UPF0127 family)
MNIFTGLILLAQIIFSHYISSHSQTASSITESSTASLLKQTSQPGLIINNKQIILELADTQEKQTLGLSGRKNLPENNAMLFIFETPGKEAFWMKDMNFNIDIIWLDENYKIVGIKENAEPDSYPETFTPDEPALYVLETNAGFAKKYGIKAGTTLDIRK